MVGRSCSTSPRTRSRLATALGELYETANVRAIRETFQKLLPRPAAYMIYGPPGSQKSYVLEHEIARLNRTELPRTDMAVAPTTSMPRRHRSRAR